jgi:hypothetical protein
VQIQHGEDPQLRRRQHHAHLHLARGSAVMARQSRPRRALMPPTVPEPRREPRRHCCRATSRSTRPLDEVREPGAEHGQFEPIVAKH